MYDYVRGDKDREEVEERERYGQGIKDKRTSRRPVFLNFHHPNAIFIITSHSPPLHPNLSHSLSYTLIRLAITPLHPYS